MSDLDSNLGVNVEACRARQQRLLQATADLELDLIIVNQIEHVQYLAGPRFGWVFSPMAALRADGVMTLVAPNAAPEVHAADEVLTYEAQLHSTLRNDQVEAASDVLLELLGDNYEDKRVGVEFSSFPLHMGALASELVDIEPDLYQLRRSKDPDELARIRMAIAGTGRMYELAREIVKPGVTEIEVFNRLQSAAVAEFGEMLTGTGNDYRVNAKGGPPRNNTAAQPGELYILDLGPAYRGYFADNCRTIAVTDVSDEQQAAWEQIMKVFAYVEANVRPGVKCQTVFQEVQAILDQAPIGVFDHHLGHGIGLFPHEGPHLNPNWDDTFEVGDVFTAEPGLYDERLRAGMRLENDYLVTESGVENLTPFPLELKL
ncbi:M24 family metallopeptidase [Lignipirellula cremea]|uniref:Putative peptidase n=1 Tax=Lignipirellula cremea TaxID=2528010 RepID=A0A518DY33_9BACT|nr:Xaa-Pro peptidase family protein [Lignipirellula cremea]QDU96759.1 putative peptidase [Lignipirellula cremea]